MTKRTVIAVLSLSCCFNLSINLHAQGGSDVSQQIKQLQQVSRDAQMKNDVSLFWPYHNRLEANDCFRDSARNASSRAMCVQAEVRFGRYTAKGDTNRT